MGQLDQTTPGLPRPLPNPLTGADAGAPIDAPLRGPMAQAVRGRLDKALAGTELGPIDRSSPDGVRAIPGRRSAPSRARRAAALYRTER